MLAPPTRSRPGLTTDPELSVVIQRAARGEPAAVEELANRVHVELRELARALLRHERSDLTLQSTDLVDMVWLKLQERFGRDANWADRRAFFGAAVLAMRRMLIDHARGKNRQIRGGGWNRVELDLERHGLGGKEPDAGQVLDLVAAVDDFARVNARAAEVVRLQIYAGLTQTQVAEVLGVSQGTVELDWRAARAWLRERIARGDSDGR